MVVLRERERKAAGPSTVPLQKTEGGREHTYICAAGLALRDERCVCVCALCECCVRTS